MKLRRFLAAAMTAVMLLAAVPSTMFAAGGSGSTGTEEGKLFLDKTATLENDGSYTINMEAFATGKTTVTPPSGVPLDIVLVLDRSTSMKDRLNEGTKIDALKNSVTKFIHQVEQNGQEANVQHRVALVGFGSGSLDGVAYQSTGVYDAKGDFQKRTLNTNDKPQYIEVNTSDLVPSQTYYVTVNGKHVPLTYSKSADGYIAVAEPVDTTRTDLFGAVNGYQPAKYETLTHEELVPAVGPKKDDGKTYYDANGNQLNWVEETKPDYVKVISGDFNGTEYYINTNKNLNNPNWVKLTYKEVLGIGSWDATDGKKYVKQEPKKGNYQFKRGKNYYDAYTMENKPTGNWFLSADGKNKVTDVRVKEIKTEKCWTVNGAKYTGTLYEKQVGQGGWQFQKNGKTTNLTSEQVYVQKFLGNIPASVYKGALVNVSAPGASGKIGTASLNKAVNNNMAVEGNSATRMSIGIKMANEVFEQNPLTAQDKEDGRQRVMIVFTDGKPGRFTAKHNEIRRTETALAVNQAYVTKHVHNAAVYTIGLYPQSETDTAQTEFLSHVSSEYPDAMYIFNKVNQLPAEDNQTDTLCYLDVEGTANTHQYDKHRGAPGEYLGLTKFNTNGEAHGNWYYRAWQEIGYGGFIDVTSAENVYQAVPEFGTRATDSTGKAKTYSFEVDNDQALNEVFQTISGEISSSTSVDLTTTSILRDIMSAEGFELTANSVITVSVVPGDASKATSETDIKWETPVKVLTLTDPTDGASATGTYKNMTIKASTYMKNPDGKANLHTVDVTGFDYKDQYIAKAHKGSKLVVEITGVKALPTVTTDQNIYTNHEQSGIWAPATAGGDRQFKAPFPKMPQTYMPSKSYVVDYAKPLDLAISDLKMTSAKDIDQNGYEPFNTAKPTTMIDPKYGKVTLNGQKMNYVPQTMNWDGYDTFYVFGTTTDKTVTAASANANGNVWGKVNVIPANNVYYEDSFITNDSNGTVGITYTGDWEVIGNDTNTTKPEDNSNPSDNHGWIPVLDGKGGDTAGSSHKADATDANAKAIFTFTGTGVDVYSRTNSKTGTIRALLKDSNGKAMMMKIVDTLSASGEYYQIPTLTFHKDGAGNNLPYGTYTVELTVTNQAAGRMEYYLDGIRVYNPIQTGDPVVDSAYGSDELNATFMEVRDMLLDAGSFSNVKTTVEKGYVFIDQLNNGTDGAPGTEGTTIDIGTYKDLGPKNEVYLKNNQMISFKVDTTKGNQFQVGLKSPTGTPVTVELTNGASGKASFELSHTADMFYVVQPDEQGYIHIKNTSNALLSVTKLKVTNGTTPVDAAQVFAPVETTELVASARTFSMAPVPGPDVEIPDPQPPVEPEKPSKPSIEDILNDIFGGIFGWN